MIAHVVAIVSLAIPAGEGHAYYEFRWVCSCDRVGKFSPNVRAARNGGARHVAAMERR